MNAKLSSFNRTFRRNGDQTGRNSAGHRQSVRSTFRIVDTRNVGRNARMNNRPLLLPYRRRPGEIPNCGDKTRAAQMKFSQ